MSMMLKYDSRDPLAGIVNKSIELAEEVQKFYRLDDKLTKDLSEYLRLIAMAKAVGIKCDGYYVKDGSKVQLEITEEQINDLMDKMVLTLIALDVNPLDSIPATYWHLCDEGKIK